MLTYKNIDKRTFFSVPIHFKTINEIIKELDKPNELKWPCRAENEVKHFPSFWSKFFLTISSFSLFLQLNIDRKASLEISATPICKFSASRSLSCAMELNFTPPCLLINGLGFDIFIIEPMSEKECCVQSNYIIIPMTITVKKNF